MSKQYKSFKAESKLGVLLEKVVIIYGKLLIIVVGLFILAIITKENKFIDTILGVATYANIVVGAFTILLCIINNIITHINIKFAKEYLKEAISKYCPENIKYDGVSHSTFCYKENECTHLYHIELCDFVSWYEKTEESLKKEFYLNIQRTICELEKIWPAQKGKIEVGIGIDWVNSDEIKIYFC